jgi:hypothetical protein
MTGWREERYPITYNSCEGTEFVVHMDNGRRLAFKRSEDPKGLYYPDTAVAERAMHEVSREGVNRDERGVVLLNTVANNRAKYSERDYKAATEAGRLQNIVGHPSLREYLQWVSQGSLPDYPINREDILAAEDIFGPSVGCLQGKTVRKKSPIVPELQQSIPPTIYHDTDT